MLLSAARFTKASVREVTDTALSHLPDDKKAKVQYIFIHGYACVSIFSCTDWGETAPVSRYRFLDPLRQTKVADGDLLAVAASGHDGHSFVLASFHGDTNGLATEPVVQAVDGAFNMEWAAQKYALRPAQALRPGGLGWLASMWASGRPGRRANRPLARWYVGRWAAGQAGDVYIRAWLSPSSIREHQRRRQRLALTVSTR